MIDVIDELARRKGRRVAREDLGVHVRIHLAIASVSSSSPCRRAFSSSTFREYGRRATSYSASRASSRKVRYV
jgi:hypothetical protein